MSRAVVVVDSTSRGTGSAIVYKSVSQAAESIGYDNSTVHRALTGDRNIEMVADRYYVFDLETV